jgi:phosphoribosyl 1,2-cyclic phosphodiesterase
MTIQFHVLASGSSGNASVLDAGGFGILLDFGLSPRGLAPRMRQCRVAWDRIRAVVLTHEHSDHWSASTLSHLAKLGVPIYCHREHLTALDRGSRAFASLSAARLIRHYEPGESFTLNSTCRCLPFAVPHDGVTCGFRFDGPGWSVGYAADLGCWAPALARQLADVDILAIEFNHDVELQLRSGRHPHLIRRVLGDQGHLSNEQGAALFAEVLRHSTPGRVKHLVQLHLSRDCNRPDLAYLAAQKVLAKLGCEVPIHTTEQGRGGPALRLGPPQPRYVQPMLPFVVEDAIAS